MIRLPSSGECYQKIIFNKFNNRVEGSAAVSGYFCKKSAECAEIM